jgi:hypothetical protein
VDDVISVLVDNNVDIAFISETWLSSLTNLTTSILKKSGFNITHNFREKRGGGVGIIWNNKLDKQVRNGSVSRSFATFQYQNIIFQGKFKMNLMCIYRLQETSFGLFLQEFHDLLSDQDLQHPLVVTGGFNVHFENSDSQSVKDLVNVTSSFGLSQFVTGSTHKFGHTLDLIFANSLDFEMNDIKTVNLNLSDHFPIFFDLPNKHKLDPTSNKKVISYRDLKSLDVPGFVSDLSTSLNLSLGQNTDNLGFCDMLEIYNHTIGRKFNEIAPVKTKTLTTIVSPPWMDTEYRANRATRRRLEREWKKSSLPSSKKLYVEQRDLCVKMSQEKRTKYYRELIHNSKGDQRALFNIVNNILDKNKSRGVLPHYDSPIKLANDFNSFYLNKVQKLRDDIPSSGGNANLTDHSFNGTRLESFRPTTVAELRMILKKSGIKTSFNDILPAKILKQVIEVLLPYLCELINKSLVTGSVEGMKQSIVVPLLKKAGLNPEIMKNYRPVADLVFLSKLSERVVAIRLDEHLIKNNLNCDFEHGYKPHHSTETMLLHLVNNVLLSLDNNNATMLLLIDLSAAFDTVDIDLLLDILESEIGIGGTALKWFESFLKNRSQSVLIENTLSNSLTVKILSTSRISPVA